MGELLYETLKALAISLGVGAVTLFITMVISMFAIRNRVQGRLWLEFIEPNNDITGGLYKPSSRTVKVKDPDGKEVGYIVNPNKQFRKMYPPGWPKVVQEPVVAQIHIRGVDEPIDPRGLAERTSDEIYQIIQDAAVAREVTQAAERAVGTKVGVINGSRLLFLFSFLFSFLACICAGAAAWFTYNMADQVQKIIEILGG